MQVKVFYKNPSFWTNVISVGVIVAGTFFGIAVPATLSAALISIVNMVLISDQLAVTETQAKARNARNLKLETP